MDDFLIKGIAFIIVITVGGLFYNAVSKKIELTWPKVIGGYAVAVTIMLFGSAVDSGVIMVIGMILFFACGLLIYGKMFK